MMLALMENLPARVYSRTPPAVFCASIRPWPGIWLERPGPGGGQIGCGFLHRRQAGKALADEKEIIRTGQPLLNSEEKATRPGGTEIWVLTTKLPLRDGAGRIMGTCGITSDITERKQAELSALAMSKLGQGLILATTLNEAARLLLKVANELFGWDACGFYLYSPETDLIRPVVYMDTIAGNGWKFRPRARMASPARAIAASLSKGPSWC